MSKLGEILEKLREKKSDQIASPKNVFEGKLEDYSSQRKTNVALRILIILLFFGSVLGGYFTVKILEKFTSPKKNHIGQRVIIPPQDHALTKPTGSLNATHTEEMHTNLEDTKKSTKPNQANKTAIASKAIKVISSSKIASKSEEAKKEIRSTKQLKEKPLLTKKTNTAKPDHYSAVPSPQEGPPILREDGLLKNLLLNAEEEVAKGNYQSAKIFYERYLAQRQDPEVLNNYGSVLFLLEDYKAAEKAFAKALSLRQDPTFKLNLIMSKLKLNQYTSACQIYREAQRDLERFEEATLIKDICSKKGL